MNQEIYDVNSVKDEYLQGMYPEYQKVYTQMQLDMSVYMLNDFVTNLAANGLMLIRAQPEPQPQAQQPFNPFENKQYQQAEKEAEERRIMMEKMKVDRDIQEMNEQLKERDLRMVPNDTLGNGNDDIDVSDDKPKTFLEKMRNISKPSARPKRDINPDEEDF